MGNWILTIQGTGCHHNCTAEHDIDLLAPKLLAQVIAQGHHIESATINYGFRDDLTTSILMQRALDTPPEVASLERTEIVPKPLSAEGKALSCAQAAPLVENDDAAKILLGSVDAHGQLMPGSIVERQAASVCADCGQPECGRGCARYGTGRAFPESED